MKNVEKTKSFKWLHDMKKANSGQWPKIVGSNQNLTPESYLKTQEELKEFLSKRVGDIKKTA